MQIEINMITVLSRKFEVCICQIGHNNLWWWNPKQRRTLASNGGICSTKQLKSNVFSFNGKPFHVCGLVVFGCFTQEHPYRVRLVAHNWQFRDICNLCTQTFCFLFDITVVNYKFFELLLNSGVSFCCYAFVLLFSVALLCCLAWTISKISFIKSSWSSPRSFPKFSCIFALWFLRSSRIFNECEWTRPIANEKGPWVMQS